MPSGALSAVPPHLLLAGVAMLLVRNVQQLSAPATAPKAPAAPSAEPLAFLWPSRPNLRLQFEAGEPPRLMLSSTPGYDGVVHGPPLPRRRFQLMRRHSAPRRPRPACSGASRGQSLQRAVRQTSTVCVTVCVTARITTRGVPPNCHGAPVGTPLRQVARRCAICARCPLSSWLASVPTSCHHAR